MRAALFVQGKAITETMDARGNTVKELMFALNKSNIYPKLKPKWDATFKQKNVYAISLTASPTKTVDAHFTSGEKGENNNKDVDIISKLENEIKSKLRKTKISQKAREEIDDLLSKKDLESLNAAKVYLENKNISGRVIKNVGVLKKVINKPVVSAYLDRFKNFDLIDAAGKKLDISEFTDTDIKNLFENKLFVKYKGKNVQIKFEAHHIIPKSLLIDGDLKELRSFVERNKDKFDFNGLDNGIPVHKYYDDFPKLGGHSNHPNYSSLSKDIIREIKRKSFKKGKFIQSEFDEKLLDHINKTRNEIVQQVATDSKKINDLIFKK